MIILVCGGRDYQNSPNVFKQLDTIHAKTSITCIIHGCARGADTFAEDWAKSRQVDYRGFPARWTVDGKRKAGPLRNQRMLDNNDVDLVVAFPGDTGTSHMVACAKIDEIKVKDLR